MNAFDSAWESLSLTVYVYVCVCLCSGACECSSLSFMKNTQDKNWVDKGFSSVQAICWHDEDVESMVAPIIIKQHFFAVACVCVCGWYQFVNRELLLSRNSKHSNEGIHTQIRHVSIFHSYPSYHDVWILFYFGPSCLLHTHSHTFTHRFKR